MACSTLSNPKIQRRCNVGVNILGGSIGHGNNIVVCCSNHIYTYDADSLNRRCTSAAGGSYYDVCRINCNQYAATDSRNKCIAIFDEHLCRVKSIGHFQYPHGICATSDGQLLVTDKVAKCVYLVDSSNGSICATIGQGQFRHPEHVAVNSNNVVFVTDYEANVVKAFNMQGCQLFSISTAGNCGGSQLLDTDCIHLPIDGRIGMKQQYIPHHDHLTQNNSLLTNRWTFFVQNA
ncbi:unnamed protein product [Owenia fusiformis]|uniref:Uncharacterized protein n=1 Tax=Owenia fusiformis TaxID=6347 RepID=A0A8S4PG94_OWEFU|nr:unnamed protein product [Owenia fusiformis]